MNPKDNFIAGGGWGGGWVKHKRAIKPKAVLWTLLAVLWLVVCFVVSLPFWDRFPAVVSWLDWLYLCPIAVEPVFVVVAVRYWLVEQSVTTTSWRENPNCDPRNLY